MLPKWQYNGIQLFFESTALVGITEFIYWMTKETNCILPFHFCKKIGL